MSGGRIHKAEGNIIQVQKERFLGRPMKRWRACNIRTNFSRPHTG